MPKVSVMMPAYNVEQYIGEAIESILNQTFQDFELIIIDDGSTDDTYALGRQYAQSHANIRLLQNEQNRGIAYTRNRLLEKAKGEYLAVLDSDDVSLPDRLEKQVRFLDNHPEVGLLGGWVRYFGTPEVEGKVSERLMGAKRIACRLLFSNVFGQSTVMFRRELAPLRYDMAMPPAEDYHLWVRMSWETATENLPEVLVRHRVHERNISTLQADVIRRNVREIHRQQLERLGVSPTLAQLDLHYGIGSQQLEVCADTLMAALDWLSILDRQNRETKKYPQGAFNLELAYHINYLLTTFYPLGSSPMAKALNYPLVRTLIPKTRRWKFQLLASGDSPSASPLGRALYRTYKKMKP